MKTILLHGPLLCMYLRKSLLLVLLLTIIQSSSFAQWNLPGDFGNGVDATVATTSGILIFKSDEKVSYTGESDVATKISTINNWPATWKGITASLAMDATTTLLFSGSSYLSYDNASNSITGGDVWPGMPASWGNQLDAAVSWSEGVYYLFYQNQFVTYDSGTQQYSEVSDLSIWGLPANWNNTIDAAMNGGDGSVYFFKNGQFIIFDQNSGEFSGVMPINEGGSVALNLPSPGVKAGGMNISSPTVSVGAAVQTTSNPDPRRAAAATQVVEEEVYVEEEEADPLRPTTPFPDKYRDDFKSYNPALRSNTFGATTGSLKPLPGKNWIGTGVDILRVDPLNVNKSKRAPKKVFALVDSDIQAGNMSEFIIPFGTTFESIGFSEVKEGEKMLSSYTEMTTAFGGSIGVEAGVAEVASGSASSSYRQMNTAKFGTESVYGYKQSFNRLYKVTVNTDWRDNKNGLLYRQKLDASFRKLIENLKVPSSIDDLPTTMKRGDKLPAKYNGMKTAYANLYRYFGTHITKSITYGGRFISMYEVTRKQYENSREDEAGFQAAVSGSIKMVQLGANASFEYTNAKTEKTESSDFHQRSYVSGGNATTYDKWENSIENAPAAIEFDLIPLSDLLNDIYFPNDKDIEKKSRILYAVMMEYMVNNSIPPLEIDFDEKGFWRDVAPLEYIYDVDFLITCKQVASDEAGSANEVYGYIEVKRDQGAYKRVWDVHESDAVDMIKDASRKVRPREPYSVTLKEGEKATVTVSSHLKEDDDTSKDDDLKWKYISIPIHETLGKPTDHYIEHAWDGDEFEIKVTITRKLKVESY